MSKWGAPSWCLTTQGVCVVHMPCCQRRRGRGFVCSGASTWKRPCAAVPGGHSLCSGPLTGRGPTAYIALSSGLIRVLRGPMRSLRALAANATVASGLWTTAACRIMSTFSFSTCRQGGLEVADRSGSYGNEVEIAPNLDYPLGDVNSAEAMEALLHELHKKDYLTCRASSGKL